MTLSGTRGTVLRSTAPAGPLRRIDGCTNTRRTPSPPGRLLTALWTKLGSIPELPTTVWTEFRHNFSLETPPKKAAYWFPLCGQLKSKKRAVRNFLNHLS